jgi:hypothetical protein
MSRYPEPVETRLWARVARGSPDQCWEWQGAITGHGYGSIRERCISRGCHVIAYRSAVGPVPEGMMVCHTCDNRKCCNPAHLFLGTALDNNRDRENKGRGNPPIGERAPAAKLTAADVGLIRLLLACGAKQRPLARLFGVTQMAVNNIAHHRTWAHVEELRS